VILFNQMYIRKKINEYMRENSILRGNCLELVSVNCHFRYNS